MITNEPRHFGDYVLGRQLGTGGMGVVYEAHPAGSGQKVALKLIREVHLASRNDLRRFTQEAEATARLDHPNIVHIREVGECDGQPFFSMDLVEGESLYVKIMRGEYVSPPPPGDGAAKLNRQRQETIARLLATIAHAVHHAHERGILHRDLKPGNILIDHHGEPHLTDFGLAKILHPALDDKKSLLATTPGDLLGTPHYMAPEQISGAVMTRASDIYSLGAILYELLTGQPPFTGATTLEMLRQIAEAPPARPRSLEPAIARALETLCLKCLEKDPRHRFISAEALAEDLERWLAGKRIQTQPPSLYRQTREWVRRNRVASTLMASLSLGLAVALVLVGKLEEKRVDLVRDRFQTYEDSMAKVDLLWRDPKTRDATFSPRELAIMAGLAPRDENTIQVKLSFGASTGAEPSSTAQYYSRWLSLLQQELERALRASVGFQLKLYKQFNKDDQTLASKDREVDLMVLSAVNFLNAQHTAPGITAIARVEEAREVVIFAHSNALAQSLAGKSIVFPDADLTMTTWAKARLLQAGLRAPDFQSCLTIEDQGNETGRLVISSVETLNTVLRKEADAGVGYRAQFERNKHWGLTMLDHFPETPNVLAARQGLPADRIQALHRAIVALRTKATFNTLTVHGTGPMSPVTNAEFDPLRRAMQAAKEFDGAITPGK